jgi:hypothetical protein
VRTDQRVSIQVDSQLRTTAPHVERPSRAVLDCHIVGERAVELAQLAAVAIASRMKVDEPALVPLSFPTDADALGRMAISLAREVGAPQVETEDQPEMTGPVP